MLPQTAASTARGRGIGIRSQQARDLEAGQQAGPTRSHRRHAGAAPLRVPLHGFPGPATDVVTELDTFLRANSGPLGVLRDNYYNYCAVKV